MKIDIYEYPIQLQKIPERWGGGFFACIPSLGEMAFCGDGESVQEALDSLQIVTDVLAQDYKERGLTLPEPLPFDDGWKVDLLPIKDKS